MIIRRIGPVILLSLLGMLCSLGCNARQAETDTSPVPVKRDTLPEADAKTRFTGLTDTDFKIVAQELGVEIAAIKAVVRIEAGESMKGFWAPEVPVVNFDNAMFAKYRKKGSAQKNAKVPEGLSGYPLKEWTYLTNARRVAGSAADLASFWGMFQIGGFNWRLCGCKNIEEFVELMSTSELEQLELFATLIVNTGMLPDLKAKNWSGFARKYNGANYARKGYHTRMANAYAKYKKEEKQGK